MLPILQAELIRQTSGERIRRQMYVCDVCVVEFNVPLDTVCHFRHRCKKHFYVFLFRARFLRVLFFQRFFIFKNVH